MTAFHYFDKNRTGYVKASDLELIIHGLGKNLSKRYVRDLVSRAADVKKSSRIYYDAICYS